MMKFLHYFSMRDIIQQLIIFYISKVNWNISGFHCEWLSNSVELDTEYESVTAF